MQQVGKARYLNVSKPLVDINLTTLHKPIDPSELEINTKGWLYLRKAGYETRLQRINYSLLPLGPIKHINNLRYQEFGLYINDQFISEAFGESSKEQGWENDLEYTALVRVCKDLLVASELWDPSKSNRISRG